MEATNIIIAVIGVLSLLTVGGLILLGSYTTVKIKLIYEDLLELRREVMRARQAEDMHNSISDQIIARMQNIESRTGRLEGALFQAQIGERLAEAERLTNLVKVIETDNGIEVHFLQDEQDPKRKVHVITANEFRNV